MQRFNSNCDFVAKILALEYGLTLQRNVWERHDVVLIRYTNMADSNSEGRIELKTNDFALVYNNIILNI